MRFGVREICDVVLRAKAIQKIGNKVFYKDEPVLYFDSLKTSSLEGAATTVYAQGGRGNSRLIAWEGERTVTFTMEDALISPAGFSILSGAGLVTPEISQVHITERTNNIELVKSNEQIWNGTYSPADETVEPLSNVAYFIKINQKYIFIPNNNDITYDAEAGWSYTYQGNSYTSFYVQNKATLGKDALCVYVDQQPYEPENSTYKANYIYVMRVYNDEVVTEPFIPLKNNIVQMDGSSPYAGKWRLIIANSTDTTKGLYTAELDKGWCHHENPDNPSSALVLDDNCVAFVDYYVSKRSVQQIDITPDKFGGNYYLEASTLFRDTNGVDLPAEFIIPNCKIQSNFTFSMASSGDPSTFTFTMDAFPDYTKFDPTKKVLASIQIIDATSGAGGVTSRTVSGKEWSLDSGESVANRKQTWADEQPIND